MDAIDFVEMFLGDEAQIDPDELNDQYVLVNFRPAVTKKNWRMDCGVAAYDNKFGLPPFFPTRLRFEDYIYRLWIQQDGHRRRARRRRAEPHQEQLHAQPAGGRDLQRGGVEPAQEEDQELAHPPRRPEHLVRLRRIGHRGGRPGDPGEDLRALHAAPRTPPGRRDSPERAAALRSSPRTCASRSTASSRTSSSRTCCASSTTC